MSKSFVALVGRPNVGKSTLFNRLVGERLSVVDDRPGTTRDRVQAPVDWRGQTFTLVDTGGIEPLEPLRDKEKRVLAENSADFVYEIREQAEIAIEEADVIVFAVDARVGLTSIDEAVADILRRLIGQRQRAGRTVPPILVAAGKADTQALKTNALEFYTLGLGDVFPLSGLHGEGTGDLLDAIVEALPPQQEDEADETVKIALVGRPNVGKSSMFNQLIGEPRVIVSPVAGTTRDAIDTVIEFRQERTEDGRPTTDDRQPTVSAAVIVDNDDEIEAVEDDDFEDDIDDLDDESDEGDGLDFEEDDFTDTADLATIDDDNGPSDVRRPSSVVSDNTLTAAKITLIDTAGIRKRGAIEPGVEKYSVLRAFKAMERADVVLLLIDATEGITAQDEHIAGYILDENKSVVVCVNKWDQVESPDKVERAAKPVKGLGLLTEKMEEFMQVVQRRLNFMSYVPVMFVSAKTGFRCDEIFPTALRAYEARSMRIPTSDVNRILRESAEKHAPPSRGGRRLKILFATQVGVNPPHFVFTVNDPKLVHFTYERFLENRLRDEYGFLGTPIRLTFKGRRES